MAKISNHKGNSVLPMALILALAFSGFLINFVSGFNSDRIFSKSNAPPAVFVFGDSMSDVGNLIETFPFYIPAENLPYGSTFFGVPTGRSSDGRLIIDFMASKWGLPFFDPYFKNIGANYRHGVNFAESSSTVRNITSLLPPRQIFALPLQTDHFVRFKRKVLATIHSNHSSEVLVSSLPAAEAFSDGVYLIEIGINDIFYDISDNFTLDHIRKNTVPIIISGLSKAIRDLHKEEAKKFMVFNYFPIGCFPGPQAVASQGPFNYSRDELGCLREYNELIKFVNYELENSLVNINVELENINITIVDIHKFILDAIANPRSYGFKASEKFKACCGYGGGRYNYNPSVLCGRDGEAKACGNPREYLSWDGYHFTDGFSQQFVEQLATGTGYLKPVHA